MKDEHRRSTLSARFSAPSSSNPAQLPNEMKKGFLASPTDDVEAPKGDLALHTLVSQMLDGVREILPEAECLEAPICQCDTFCSHRRASFRALVGLAQERLAQSDASLRQLRAEIERKRQQALTAAVRTTEQNWIAHGRAQECAKMLNLEKKFRPFDVLTGPNNKMRCVKVAPNRPYCLLRLLGRGGFSSVWEVYDRDACKHMAAKLTLMPSSDDSEGRDAAKWLLECLTREVMLLKNDRTPTLLGTHDCFPWSLEGQARGVATIHDLCECDLAVWMKRVSLSKRPRALLKRWLRDILEGLDHLHARRGVLHTDLKPENILKGVCDIQSCGCSSSRCKIADFGLHKVLVESAHGKTCKVDMSDEGNWNGTLIYQAPEHLTALLEQDKAYAMTVGSDIWSAGVIALELLQDVMPFRPKIFKRDINDIAARVLATHRTLRINANEPMEEQFLRKMLALNPNDRCTASELLADPFLSRDTVTREGVAAVLSEALAITPGADGANNQRSPSSKST